MNSLLLLLAICTTESGLRNVINVDDNGSASFGICQVKHSTAEMFHKGIHSTQLMEPGTNLLLAHKYLTYQMDRYPTNINCAIAAYNAGSCKRNGLGKIYNSRYVARVLAEYASLKDLLKYDETEKEERTDTVYDAVVAD